MYPQPIRSQQTWSSAQFAQGPKAPPLSTWPTAPVISTMQNPAAAAVPHVGPHPSFVPPAPPGVNPQQWQNGRWMYNAPPGGVSNAQPHGLYPPPSMVGWHIPATWGIAQQYYYPQAQQEKQPDKSYWDTKLSDNGLGLQNMHIKCAISSFCSLTVPNYRSFGPRITGRSEERIRRRVREMHPVLLGRGFPSSMTTIPPPSQTVVSNTIVPSNRSNRAQ